MLERITGPDQTSELYDHLTHEDNWFWWIEGAKPTYTHFEDWVRASLSDSIGLFLHRIRRAEKDELLGFSRLSRTNLTHGTSYLTVWIAPRWRNTSGLLPFGTVATAEILQFCFQNYPLRKIYQHIVCDNQVSLRPAHKVFQIEGVLKEYYFFQGGYRDVEILSVTRDKWLTLAQRYHRKLEALF